MANEIYLKHVDEASARTDAASLGIVFPETGEIPTGNENYSLFTPIQNPWKSEPVYNKDGSVKTPGVKETGYWSMLWLNPAWPGYQITLDAIDNLGIRQYPAIPSVVMS